MNRKEFRCEIDKLAELVEGWNAPGEVPALERDLALETLRRLYSARIRPNQGIQRQRVAKVTGESGGSESAVTRQPTKKTVKIGRNDPCPCGSGLKWKKCTCAEYHSQEQ